MKPRKQLFSKIAFNQQEKRTDKEQYTVEVRIVDMLAELRVRSHCMVGLNCCISNISSGTA